MQVAGLRRSPLAGGNQNDSGGGVARMEDSYSLRVDMLRGMAEELGLDLDAVAVDLVKATVKRAELLVKVERVRDVFGEGEDGRAK